jgi:hypothetical protein
MPPKMIIPIAERKKKLHNPSKVQNSFHRVSSRNLEIKSNGKH